MHNQLYFFSDNNGETHSTNNIYCSVQTRVIDNLTFDWLTRGHPLLMLKIGNKQKPKSFNFLISQKGNPENSSRNITKLFSLMLLKEEKKKKLKFFSHMTNEEESRPNWRRNRKPIYPHLWAVTRVSMKRKPSNLGANFSFEEEDEFCEEAFSRVLLSSCKKKKNKKSASDTKRRKVLLFTK